MNKNIKAFALVSGMLFSSTTWATLFTTTSPTSGGTLAGGFTEVGGVVVDMIGTNGNRVTSQVAASGLFEGFCHTGSPVAYQGNPCTIGIQEGYDSSITSLLGGGIDELGVRITLWDGDTGTNNFDEDDNSFLINGINFGNWSDVNAEETSADGTVSNGFSGGGFRDNTLDTGWFFSSSSTLLTSLFDSIISTERLLFQLTDDDPYDNLFDFTQGVDGSLIDTSVGPTITPGPTTSVPTPATLALFALGLLGVAATRRGRTS